MLHVKGSSQRVLKQHADGQGQLAQCYVVWPSLQNRMSCKECTSASSQLPQGEANRCHQKSTRPASITSPRAERLLLISMASSRRSRSCSTCRQAFFLCLLEENAASVFFNRSQPPRSQKCLGSAALAGPEKIVVWMCTQPRCNLLVMRSTPPC